jgi:16S rRNA C967 or C1407 C5-methylase (RsmB/RsmF family)
MARGYSGQSKEDIAINNMLRQNKKNKSAYKAPPKNLLESIQAAFPDTWKEEIEKMKREHADKIRNNTGTED